MGTGTTEREVNHEPQFDPRCLRDYGACKSQSDEMFEVMNYNNNLLVG